MCQILEGLFFACTKSLNPHNNPISYLTIFKLYERRKWAQSDSEIFWWF